MEEKITKIISFALVLCIVFTFSFTVFADESELPEESSSEVVSQEPSSQAQSTVPVVSNPVESQQVQDEEQSTNETETSVESIQQSSSKYPSSSETSSQDIWSSGKDIFYWTDEMGDAMESACSWLNLNQKSDSYLVTMGIAGYSADISFSVKIKNEIVQRGGEYSSLFELSNDILTLLFSGDNPQNYSGLNLLEILYEYESPETVEDLAFTLIAYESGGYDVPEDVNNNKDSVIQRLLDKQNDDGSFGTDNNIVETAYAVTALSKYTDIDNINEALQKALNYFMEKHTDDGEFLYDGEPSSQNVSAVIMAISSLSISIDDSRFIKNEKNLIDILLDYQLSDGGFADISSDSSDVYSTELAVVALMAACHQSNPFTQQYELSYASSNDSQESEEDNGDYYWAWIPVTFLGLIAADAIVIFKRRKKHKNNIEVEEDKKE